MKHKIYLIPLLVAVIFISSCIPKPAGEVPTAETEQEKITERDDFGCFSSCKYFPEGSPRQMCEDWKAGKNVQWPDCSFMSGFPACMKLCEFDKKNNPQADTGTDWSPFSNQSGSESKIDMGPDSTSYASQLKEVPPFCVNGDEDHRAQLVYARPQDASDRYNLLAPKIRKWAGQGNRIVKAEAKRFKVNANLKRACEGGKLSVLNVVLTTVTTKRA